MIATILHSAPATNAPLDEWRAWARNLSPDELEALSVAFASATAGASEDRRRRLRAWIGSLGAPHVQAVVLRELDPRPDRAESGETNA